jgi:transposase
VPLIVAGRPALAVGTRLPVLRPTSHGRWDKLKRKHVTLQILWDEYIERHPEGYRYSRFCELYRAYEGDHL